MKMALGFLLLGVVSVGYASSVVKLGYTPASSYIPAGLVESCVDFSDIPDIRKAFVWVNSNLPENAVVVVPEALQGFASMYSSPSMRILVAPALLSLSDVVEKISKSECVYYAVFYKSEPTTSNKLKDLTRFGSVQVYRIEV
jgi:hypothetical protein